MHRRRTTEGDAVIVSKQGCICQVSLYQGTPYRGCTGIVAVNRGCTIAVSYVPSCPFMLYRAYMSRVLLLRRYCCRILETGPGTPHAGGGRFVCAPFSQNCAHFACTLYHDTIPPTFARGTASEIKLHYDYSSLIYD